MAGSYVAQERSLAGIPHQLLRCRNPRYRRAVAKSPLVRVTISVYIHGHSTKASRMTFTLSDGTEVEYHVLRSADAAAAVCSSSDDATMFVKMIRLAVVNPDTELQHIGALPDASGQTALLGTEIVLATLRALRTPEE